MIHRIETVRRKKILELELSEAMATKEIESSLPAILLPARRHLIVSISSLTQKRHTIHTHRRSMVDHRLIYVIAHLF